MLSLPPLPPWDGLHPLVIHFPIALIMVAPIFVVLALLSRKHCAQWLSAGALVMVLAAAGALLATSTGEEAGEVAEKVPGAKAILEEHEELGEAAQNFAIGLAGALVIGAGVVWKWGAKVPRIAIIGVGVVYLIANAAGMLVVANAAHQGGRLVHEVGVRARLSPSAPATAGTADLRTDQGGSHDND